MGKLKILAGGDSPSAQANARGHLFEDLIAEVLRHSGYVIENKPNVNYAGMEIDIEGKTRLNDIKIYAECKCHDKEIDSTKFVAFFGKYMKMWLNDHHCQGLFIAIPGINSHAKGFYNDCKNDSRFNIRVLNEDDIIKNIIESGITASYDLIENSINNETTVAGDWNILYTDSGLFWIQFILQKGEGTPSSLMIFDSKCHLVTDSKTIDYLISLNSELSNFQILCNLEPNKIPSENKFESLDEQIVKVKGSSSCFEYQFPASPDFFIGRKKEKAEVISFINQVINKEITARGLLLEGNSGWGKSSLALTIVDELQQRGHFAITIDSRTASSSQFVLKVIEFSLTNFGDFNGILQNNDQNLPITGFDGGVAKLLNLGSELERNGKILVIILDQFENIFYKPDVLNRIRDLFIKITDSQTNIILGFSWKTDLVGSTNEFPFEIRDYIKNSSRRIILRQFNDQDTADLLNRLESELKPKRRLSKDLKFFLSDFSQGYPWTLKKLCSHVKSQIESGLTQEDIATRLLNIEDLFCDDVEDLNQEELDTLHRIAKIAPIGFQELSNEDFNPDIVQNLVNSRLVMKIGPKYDIYWDIFRDYLNTDRLPIQENYLLRAYPGSVVKSIQILNEMSGKLPVSVFIEKAKLTNKKSFYNVARDIRLLGLAQIDSKEISLNVNLPAETIDFNLALKPLINEKIKYNRLVKQIVDQLNINGQMTLSEVSKLLSKLCPYIVASSETWDIYSSILLIWIDFADLAIYDKHEKIVHSQLSDKKIKKQSIIIPGKRSVLRTPRIQAYWIEKLSIRIYEASKTNKPLNLEGFRKSTYSKAINTMEDLGFIQRKPTSIEIKQPLIDFIENKNERCTIFAKHARNFESYRIIIEILNEDFAKKMSYVELCDEYEKRSREILSRNTVKWNIKILLNWARYAKDIDIYYIGKRTKSKIDKTQQRLINHSK